jgi:hypothetical protein
MCRAGLGPFCNGLDLVRVHGHPWSRDDMP